MISCILSLDCFPRAVDLTDVPLDPSMVLKLVQIGYLNNLSKYIWG